MVSSCRKFLLDLRDPLVEIVHQVLLLIIDIFLIFINLESLVSIADLLLQLLDLCGILLDNLLTEVRTLCQLFLNFLVIRQVLRQILNDACHLVVLVHQVLSLHRLILELTS